MLNNKSILITGGTGTFGQAFAAHVAAHYKPRRLIVYSRDEFKQSLMAEKFSQHWMRWFIGDVRDINRLSIALEGVDIVIHAAALKQVPACEYNPLEAVKTNVDGSANVVSACLDRGVSQAMLISTDKAVNPTNLYGATKLLAERIFISGNNLAGGKKTRFSVCRYGNVIDSRGSVYQIFRNLSEESRSFFPITHPEMTRFILKSETAVKFVINAFRLMAGGEIFIPKLHSAKITAIAKMIDPGMELKVIGLRPGEKIHETLISEHEAAQTTEYDDHYRISPQCQFISTSCGIIPAGHSVPPTFNYRSDLRAGLSDNLIKEMLCQSR